MYYAQERLFNTEMTGSAALGDEKYLRIVSIVLILLSIFMSIFSGRSKYNTSIYVAFFILLGFITIIYVASGASIFDPTQIMDPRGIGTWICLGLIFVGYNDKRYFFFKRFLIFSVLFISALAFYNFIDFGIGLYRGAALSKYRLYATNLVWLSPFVFLYLKNNRKLRWLRVYAMIIGIVLALVIQTRSFLLIYVITLLYDFRNAERKSSYMALAAVGFIILLFVVLNTDILSTSLELLINRGTHDTRTEQLITFIGQLDPVEMITGEGYFASYGFGRDQWFAVDNQWLYFIWWAGLIPALSYFYLAALIPIRIAITRKLTYETKVEVFMLILWILGLAGLAIFTTMSINFFFFMISIILGRVLYKYSNGLN